ncbi:MAG TPA: hypothetical protein VHY19_05355 [Steroidobacteraceae bacterium]|jgi:hypothetical protein|nr:hypothetical protein [Steroidobacteraceae bacterium]
MSAGFSTSVSPHRAVGAGALLFCARGVRSGWSTPALAELRRAQRQAHPDTQGTAF